MIHHLISRVVFMSIVLCPLGMGNPTTFALASTLIQKNIKTVSDHHKKELEAHEPTSISPETLQDSNPDSQNKSIWTQIVSLKNYPLSFYLSNLIAISTILLRIILISILFFYVWKLSKRLTNFYIAKVLRKRNEKLDQVSSMEPIVKTVAPMIQAVIHWFLGGIFFLLILGEFRVDITPILYSLGIFSLALSIGAQALVRDLINGILTLLEGTLVVGEVVKLGNYPAGTVESLSLRCIRLRLPSGEIQTIAFSEVNSVLNMSRNYKGTAIQFYVSHAANIQKVDDVLSSVFTMMKEDPKFGPMILEPLGKSGITTISAQGSLISTMIKTIPDPGGNFASEFYKKLHAELHNQKIPLPPVSFVQKTDH